MQFLEGESLADRLARGALPVEQAVQTGIQIADALECAHRAGIIHRDLKPGNIVLTKSGAKLLDFGLAKSSAPAIAVGGATMMATTPAAITAQGAILGTIQYMAPEQIEGAEADARSDIFALGAVLYEMLAGTPAFSGKTSASLLGAILKDEPRPLAPAASPALDRVVRVCLAKAPDDRWQTAREVGRELRWLLQQPLQRDALAVVPTRRRVARVALLAAALFVLAIAAIALGASWLRQDARLPQRLTFTVEPPPGQVFPIGSGATPWPVLSPDGRRLVFGVVDEQGVERLWVRELESAAMRPLANTENAEQPFWSHDGRAIGFFAGAALKRIDPANGAVQTICTVPGTPRKASWNHDGVIIYAVGW
jgi:hypothetical protein